MKQTFTLLFFLLCPFLVFAQANFQPGYVVNLSGDTLTGYLDFKEWIQNPKSVTFKPSQASSTTSVYTPHNSLYFEVTGMEAYRRYAGPVSMNSLEINRLPVTSEVVTATDTVFLKQVATGKHVSLYKHTDFIKTRFFIRDESTKEFQELAFFKFVRDAQVSTTRHYRGQLWALAYRSENASDKLKAKIERAEYHLDDLLPIVNEINGTAQSTEKVKQGAPKSRFYVGANLARNTARFENNTIMAGEQDESVNYSPAVYAGFDSFLNPNTRRFLLRNEVGVDHVHHVIKSKVHWGDSETYDEYVMDFTYTSLNYRLQLQYNVYHTPKTKVFVSGGFGINYALTSDKEFTRTLYTYDSNNNRKASNTADFSSFVSMNHIIYNFPFRVGIVPHENVEVYLGYTKSLKPGLNHDITLGSTQLGVNYLFNKK